MPSPRDVMAQRQGGGKGGGRVNNVVRIPAPVMGWNVRDAYEAMKPTEAIVLDNWIPGLLGTKNRKGNTSYATGMTDAVESLMEYSPDDGSGREFFAAAGANIFDISTAGAVGAAAFIGLTSAVWQHTMFATSAGSFLIAVNGADDGLLYDGSNWYPISGTPVYRLNYDNQTVNFGIGGVVTGSTSGAAGTILRDNDSGTSGFLTLTGVTGTFQDNEQLNGGAALADGVATVVASAITGVAVSSLITVTAHKNRLWFAEKATLNAWYLPTSSIAGAATKFGLGGLCKLGGELTAIGSWSRDGGDGADDLLVFVTSEGEVIVYQGTDPASASTWALVGVFRIQRPLGRRCFVKAGADLGVLTVDGPVSLAQVLPAAGSAQRRATLTDKISDAFRLAYSIAPSGSLWGILEAPGEGLILINTPTAVTGESVQFVMSADTGGWCRWTGIPATCMGLFNDRIYFGKAGGVVSRYGETFTDDGALVTSRLQMAYVRPEGVEEKRYTMARPIMQGPAGYEPEFLVKVNYDQSPADIAGSTVVTVVGEEWDVAAWDEASWATAAVPITKWQGVSGIGSAVSLAFAIATDIEMTLQGVDLMYDRGGPL